MIFKTNYTIEIEDINKNKEVTNKAILKYLENSFCEHSNSLNLGIEEILKMGYTLVLLSWNLKVIKRPKYKDNINVETWIESNYKKYFYRDFKITKDGILYVVAKAKMALIDIKTKKIVQVDELLKKHKPEDIVLINDNKRLIEKDNYDKCIEYYIRKSDIDLNNHMHNLNYLDIALEIIDGDMEFNNLKIEYKKAIKYKDNIEAYLKNINGKYYIKIYNKDKKYTTTLIEMEN